MHILYFLFLLSAVTSTFATTINSTGIGENSDKNIAYNRALDNAKVQALHTAGVYIQSESELTKHADLNTFNQELKQKILQTSEGLVRLIEIVDIRYTLNTQIHQCNIEAKFDIQQSDIKDSFEIMKLLEQLSKKKVSKEELSSALQEIEKLKKSIKNQKLYNIINKNSNKIINDIKIENNVTLNVHVLG